MRRTHRITATSASIDTSVSPNVAGQIEEMRLHLDSASATTEDITVTLVSGVSSVYDTVLFSQDMDTVQDLHWQPTRPINFAAGDEVRVQWDNTNDRTYGLEVVWSALSWR